LSGIQKLFSATDYLLLPTRADASTSAIREASAFGVPSIVANVGGLAEMIADGSGVALPKESNAEQYADVIRTNYSVESQRLEMRLRARVNYETRLNWRRSSMGLGSIVESTVLAR
jgi:glycosyltransferase involved in cell wall biosynthesis